MDAALSIAAVLGFVAVGWRFARAVYDVLRRGVDSYLSGEIAETRAKRGDLTGMAEAEHRRTGARRARWRAAVELTFWGGLLVAPALTSWTMQVYAAYSVLWLIAHAVGRSRA